MRLDQSHLGRREFLNGLMGAGTAGLVAVAGETMLGYLTGSEIPEPAFVKVEGPPLAKLEKHRYVLVAYGPRPVIILRLPDGKLRAFSAVCTHATCNVRYRPEENDIFCGCHEGRFTVDGVNVPGTPPPKPLRKFYVQESEDGSLVVRAEVADEGPATTAAG